MTRIAPHMTTMTSWTIDPSMVHLHLYVAVEGLVWRGLPPSKPPPCSKVFFDESDIGTDGVLGRRSLPKPLLFQILVSLRRVATPSIARVCKKRTIASCCGPNVVRQIAGDSACADCVF